MTLRAALFFLVTHALVIAFVGPQDPVGSYLMLITAPLLAALACVRRARVSQAACQWRLLGAAVGLFSLALLALLYRNVAGLAPAQMTASTLILYVFYRIPLTYVAASPGGGNRYIRAVDLGIIALLWLLYYLHARAMAPLNTALWTQCLNTMSGVQNSLVFCFALIRFLAEDDPDRRDFFRTLTIYALGYFLLAFYINTYQPQVPDGNWGDLLISGLFVLLAILAGSHRRRPAVEVSRSLRRIVDAGVPLMLPLLLMLVALLVARLQPTLATVGFIGSLLGYALRSVLSQVEIQRQRDEHVPRHAIAGRALGASEKEQDVVLEFRPDPPRDLLLACLWAEWEGPEGRLLSFATITDTPPRDVAAAGHDRGVIPIRREHLDAWLNPDPDNLAGQYSILDDREDIRYLYEEAG